MSKVILYEDLVRLLRNVILEAYVYPDANDFLKNGKKNSWGHGDFQRAGQAGLRKSQYSVNGENVDDGYIYRNIPGVKYPFVPKQQGKTFRGQYDENDPVAKEIVTRILFGSENKKPDYIFFNGVARMVCDGEVSDEAGYKMLSDICIYLSENPSQLEPSLSASPDEMYSSKDWVNGFSNFNGMKFKELVSKFGKAAKAYCKEKNKTKVIESDLVTSNGYYVYPCYNFATANYVSSFMEQGMCYTGTDNFFHEHMGNNGVLFLFIKKEKPQQYDTNTKAYMGSGNLSLREFGIAIAVDEMSKEPYIESITDGTNMSLYNSEHKSSTTSKYFTKKDLNELSNIIGTLNGEEIFTYCLRNTQNRQDSKYDSIFNSGTYDRYEKLFYAKFAHDKLTRKIDGLDLFYDGDKFIVLDKGQETVIIITKEGFITINGNEVTNAQTEPTLAKISEYIGSLGFMKNWVGYRHNKRNPRTIEYHNSNMEEYRAALEESRLKKIIKEAVMAYLFTENK